MKQVNPIFEPQPYDAASSIRLVNPTNTRSSVRRIGPMAVSPKDIYVTRDFKTNRPTIVAIINREETKEYFDKWCKHELT